MFKASLPDLLNPNIIGKPDMTSTVLRKEQTNRNTIDAYDRLKANQFQMLTVAGEMEPCIGKTLCIIIKTVAWD